MNRKKVNVVYVVNVKTKTFSYKLDNTQMSIMTFSCESFCISRFLRNFAPRYIKAGQHVTSCNWAKETKRQGRIAHHLHRFCPAAMPPFRTSWLYLVLILPRCKGKAFYYILQTFSCFSFACIGEISDSLIPGCTLCLSLTCNCHVMVHELHIYFLYFLYFCIYYFSRKCNGSMKTFS